LLLKFFPRSVFARFENQMRLPIASIRGVHSFVGFGSSPSPMNERELSDLIRVADAGVPVGPAPYPATGSSCFLSSGPLEGLQGKLMGLGAGKGHFPMFVLSLSVLRQSVSIPVAEDWAPQPLSRLTANLGRL
jgi:transcription antitermination factor NusG